MFTLLHPLLAGSVALAGTLGVLLLYILKLRRRPLRVSTTAIFTPAVDDLEANIPWRRLRPSWMLLLHLLIVWLLALALGRPVSRGVGDPANVIFILDRSASMSAMIQGSRTQLDAAKEMLLARADGIIGSGGRVALIAAAERPSALLPMSSSRTTFRSSVQGVQAFDQPARLERAIEMARALAASARAEHAAESGEASDAAANRVTPDGPGSRDPRTSDTRIILVTDGITPIAPDFSSGIEVVRIAPAKATEPDNIGIAGVSLRRVSVASAKALLLVRLVNAGAIDRVVPLRVDVNGETRQRVAVTVPGLKIAPEISGGEAARTFDLDLPADAVVSVHLTRPDALAADDAAHIVITEPKPPRILLVAPDAVLNGPANSGAGPDLSFGLLRDVLQELVDADPERKGELLVLSPARVAAMSSETLSRFHAAVFDRTEPAANFPLGVLSFGVAAGLTSSQSSPESSGPTRPVWWDRAQPVFEDNPIEGVLVRSAPGLGKPAGGTLTLARGVHGPLVLARQAGPTMPGRFAVLFELAESNWELQVSFPVFIARAMQMLSPSSAAGVGQAALTSDTVTVPVPDAGTPRIDFRPMNGAGDVLTVEIAPNQGQIQFGPVERVGVLAVHPVAGTVNDPVRAIAFNLQDERVSRLRPAHVEKSADAVEPAGTPRSSYRMEWWRMCVISVVLLLAIEWFIFALWQRRAGR